MRSRDYDEQGRSDWRSNNEQQSANNQRGGQQQGCSYGSQGHHDPDYHQWRNEQLRNLDKDYEDWRKERYSKFSDEFNNWRSKRSSQSGNSSQGSKQHK